MQKPHVLHLASWFPSAKEPTLGNFVQRHLEAIAEQLPTTVVCTAIGSPKVEDFVEAQVRIIRISYKKRVPLISQLKAYLKGLRYLEKQGFSYNLVHVHVSYPAGLVALLLKKPLLISEHFSGFQPERKYQWGKLEKWGTRFILKKAVLILPVSKVLGQAIAEFGYNGPIKPISNAVNTSIFHFDIEQNKTNKPRYLHLSSLQNEVKNISGLLNSMALLKAQKFDFKLAIGGDGDLTWLKREVAQRKLECYVEILPNLAPLAVADEMRKATAFVLFSNVESQGVVLLESLCCGSPVIGPNVGGVPEIVSPERGILVEPNDEEGLCQALQQIANFNFNAQKVAEQAQKQYCIKTIAHQFKDAYSSVLRLNA